MLSAVLAIGLMPVNCKVPRFGLAAAYPLHVTVRGRFGTEKVTTLCDFISAERKSFSNICPEFIKFSGPINIEHEMIWLECMSDNDGFNFLHEYHRSISLKVDCFVDEDYTPLEFKFKNYRPHVTVCREHVGDYYLSMERREWIFKPTGLELYLFESLYSLRHNPVCVVR